MSTSTDLPSSIVGGYFLCLTASRAACASHFIARLDEFLFPQIYSPCVDGSNGFGASPSYTGAENHVGGRLRVKTAELKVFGNVRYLNQIADNSAVLELVFTPSAEDATGVGNWQESTRLYFVK